MATQVRSKPASKAPVTKHPLFPAMVALWFGALFGLGSLAVRASLIESLVLSLSLDVLLPAAAPPLGLKARLILALLLAAFGVAVGAMLARRIARPKPVETPRRRSVGARSAARQARADIAAAEVAEAPARRRPLAIAEEAAAGFDYDAAPLPGGAPAILDVTQFELDPLPVDAPVGDRFAELAEPMPLDPYAVDEAEHPEPASGEAFAGTELDAGLQASNSAFADVASEPSPRSFYPSAEIFSDFLAEPEPEPDFGDAPLDLLAEDEVAVTEAGSEEAEAQFTSGTIDAPRRFDGPAAIAPVPVEFNPEAVTDASSELSMAQSAAESQFEPEFAAQALPVLPSVLLAQPLALLSDGPGETKSGNRIETAELAELSPVELIERLALAMRQREHRGPMPAVLAEAVSSLVESVPAELEVAPDTGAGYLPDGEPAPHFAPFAESTESLSLLEDAPEAEPLAIAPEPVKLALPAALRPIDFGDYAEHDDGADLGLPPRSFAGPSLAASTPAGPESGAVLDLGAHHAEESEGDVLEEGYSSLLELARTAAPRQNFVRIEEPEDDAAQIEPVVIFPGHGARPGMRFAAPDPEYQAAQAALATAAEPVSPPMTGAPQLRRFDAPATTASPVLSAQAGGLRQDPEEAQRALRSALATLQRMSGAA